ncbi:glycosyltransferase family 2 protein [Vibrio genomosp. F6]|uniref:Glycosyltransferase 2-like domain-containing protein n=1 Tax=Vibrio genomosp. F6 str. FF-238 TaxID=1191298 RepID=A0A1E5D2G4_9VIBR|nr:glycosyltransferase family 2 protein [Vibrio genomosp. F6]OEE77714.1 hypothetical protein A130_14380 [Vibrio genomosp. F6 str. FF-238]
MKEFPLVSVIVPTLNRSHLLTSAVKSIEQQDYPKVEIIIVDDCSDDAVIPPDCDMPIRVIRNNIRKGGAFSRNRGVLESKGQYICFLDDDDTYRFDKISYLIGRFIENDGATVVFGSVIKSNISNHLLGKVNKNLKHSCAISSVEAIGGLHTNGSLIKRSVFDRIRFNESLRKYQDTQLHFDLIKSEKAMYFDHVVSVWNNEHEYEQVTDTKTEEQHKNGIANFIKFYQHALEKHKLNIFDLWYFYKRRMYLVAVASNAFNRFEIPVRISWYDKVVLSIFMACLKFKSGCRK